MSAQKIRKIKSFVSRYKINKVLNEKYFNNFINKLIKLNNKTFIKFLTEYKNLYNDNGIPPYKIICRLDSKHQKLVVYNLEKMNLTLNEKREILATLKTDVKDSIDTTNFPGKYKSAISMQTENYGGEVVGEVILDLDRDLEDYRGLDNLLRINPEILIHTEKDKKNFMILCGICPNMEVLNYTKHPFESYNSTVTEYKEAEKWITSIINRLDPNYSDAQKLAVIDNAIGKKLSYSPDFDTEVYDDNDSRALYKIISSGYGVCNGIAKVEQYILKRVGIESEIISGDKHAFLKIKNIALPFANGEIKKGNTILDPTWNLTEHRFAGKPNNFCISYEQARKNDIDENGKDHKCHKNDSQLKDATLSLDEQSLRNLFTSVGLADTNGQFPIKDLIEKSELLDEMYANQPEQNIKEQFLLLKKTCPEFATCQNSSMNILSSVLLNNENLKFNKCVVNRVFNRTDKNKRPILFVYIDSNEIGKKFYFADKDTGQFIELLPEKFIKKFECYEQDIKIYNGLRPWEIKEHGKEDIALSNSSGKCVAAEER